MQNWQSYNYKTINRRLLFIISLDIRHILRLWWWLQTQPTSTYRQKGCSGGLPLWSTPCWSLCLKRWFCPNKFWTRWHRSLTLCVTSVRTQHHFPSPTVQFHPASLQWSQPFSCPWIVTPTSLHLLIHLAGCFHKLPVLPLPPELCL